MKLHRCPRCKEFRPIEFMFFLEFTYKPSDPMTRRNTRLRSKRWLVCKDCMAIILGVDKVKPWTKEEMDFMESMRISVPFDRPKKKSTKP